MDKLLKCTLQVQNKREMKRDEAQKGSEGREPYLRSRGCLETQTGTSVSTREERGARAGGTHLQRETE